MYGDVNSIVTWQKTYMQVYGGREATSDDQSSPILKVHVSF